jgi:hypothetical protein
VVSGELGGGQRRLSHCRLPQGKEWEESMKAGVTASSNRFGKELQVEGFKKINAGISMEEEAQTLNLKLTTYYSELITYGL